MRAGTLRRRLAFQTQSSSVDEFGEPIDSWATTFTVWGEVTDLSGREAVKDGAYTAQITTLVTIRHRTGIVSGMRIVDGARTLEIAAPPIDKSGRVRTLELLAKQIAP